MPIDKQLQDYARAHLLRQDRSADRLVIEAFIESTDFVRVISILDRYIDSMMLRYSTLRQQETERKTTNVQPAVTGMLPSRSATVQPLHLPTLKHEPAKKIPMTTVTTSGSPTAANTLLPRAVPAASDIGAARQKAVSAPLAPLPASPEPVSSPSTAKTNAVSHDASDLTTPNTAFSRLNQPKPMMPFGRSLPLKSQDRPQPPSAPQTNVPPAVPVRAPQLAPGPPDATFRLPNARTGERYDHGLIIEGQGDEKIVYCQITLPPALGIRAVLSTGTLEGVPEIAGEHEIKVMYHYASQSPARKRLGLVKLVVNADPKSMWKDLPSNHQDVYWKPDEECGVVDGDQFQIIAASKRGRSHAHVGSFRDDDYRIGHLPDTEWYISVVSDGAGSAKSSRRGAQIICERAMAHLQKTLGDAEGIAIDNAALAFSNALSGKAEPSILETARKSLHNQVYVTVGYAAYYAVKAITEECAANIPKADKPALIKDFSSTALIAACKRYPFGTLCVAYWVGDGAVGIYSKNQGVTVLGEVDSGEYSGQTRFLEAAEVSQEALLRRTRFAIVDDLTALVLMTDGVSDPKFETEARLGQSKDWDSLWNDLDKAIALGDTSPGKEKKLLAWLDFWSVGHHDDRTISIIRPISAPRV